MLLTRNLIRTKGSELVDSLLSFLANEERGVDPPVVELSANGVLPRQPLTNPQRTTLAKELPAGMKSLAVELVESLEGKDVEIFLDLVQKMAEEAGILLKRMDKKTERIFLFSHRKVLFFHLKFEPKSSFFAHCFPPFFPVMAEISPKS